MSAPGPPFETSREGTRRASSRTRSFGLILGALLFLGVLSVADFGPDVPRAVPMAAVALLMAVWWITEAVPLAATALLPIVLFPLLGIDSGRNTAPIYINSVIFLFVGGFLIALAMERWGLHKRIALTIIGAIGGGPARLVLSFMVASAFLSMWISNTATSIMMLAIGLAIIAEEERAFGVERTGGLCTSLLLGIAYGASLGGVMTLVGTPPNLSLARIFEQTFPQAEPIAFGQWMLMGVPLGLSMLLIVWLLLTRLFFPVPRELTLAADVVDRERRALGRMSQAEKLVLGVFALTAVLWVLRGDVVLGSWTMPGWGRLLPFGELVDDGTVAITMALALFLLPAGDEEGGRLLDNHVFARVPWAVVLLFGGGFALANGFQVSGLSAVIGEEFRGLAGAAPVLLVSAVCTSMTFITELTSNTATTEMALPILAAVGVAAGFDPRLLMIPAALSASCAFMLPVATPPNAIVFASGRLSVADMARVGVVINLIGVVVVTSVFLTLGTFVFGIESGIVPDWATTLAAE